MVAELQGAGLEECDLILWLCGGMRNHIGDDGMVVADNCRLGGVALAEAFGAPVIQSNYATYAVERDEVQHLLGGSVVVSEDGEVLQQAPYTDEFLLRCEYGG